MRLSPIFWEPVKAAGGVDKMTTPYIEKYAIDAKMYGHLYGQLVVIWTNKGDMENDKERELLYYLRLDAEGT